MPKSIAKSASTGTDLATSPRELQPVRMDLADLAEVVALEEAVFPDPWSADSFLAEIERKPDIGHPLVVRDGSRLIAYAVVWFIVDELHIGNIAVHPECEGQGIASALMRHILAEGRRRDLVFATLEVRPSNERALVLYERFGFRKIAVRKNYYQNDREDALVLALSLHPGAETPLA